MSDERPDSVPFFLNSSINLAIGLVVSGLAGILAGFCKLGLFCVAFQADAWTPIIVGGYTIIAAAVWIYRRVKLGKDPAVPLPEITLTKKP